MGDSVKASETVMRFCQRYNCEVDEVRDLENDWVNEQRYFQPLGYCYLSCISVFSPVSEAYLCKVVAKTTLWETCNMEL